MYRVSIDVKDEILGGEPQYDIKDASGKILFANCSIEMVTEILQQGTPLNKELFDRIQGVINYINGQKTGETMKDFYNTGSIGNFSYSGTNFDV